MEYCKRIARAARWVAKRQSVHIVVRKKMGGL